MDKEDIKYLAASIDFEGHLYFGKNKDKKIKRGFSWKCYLTISNVNDEILYYLRNIVGGSVTPIKPSKPTYRWQYRWIVSGDDLRELLSEVNIHLIVKRKQGRLVLEALGILQKHWQNSKSGWNDDTRLEEIYQEMKHLNKRGR